MSGELKQRQYAEQAEFKCPAQSEFKFSLVRFSLNILVWFKFAQERRFMLFKSDLAVIGAPTGDTMKDLAWLNVYL